MSDGSSPRTNLGLALFLIVVSAAVLWESRGIPPGTFEPLGSAPIPRATAGIVIVLSLAIMVEAIRALRRAGAGAGGGAAEPLPYEPRPLDAVAVLALTGVYILLMQFRLIGFAVATAGFLFLAIALLTRFRPRALPVAALIGVVMGFGCRYLFTRVFYVDLPAG